MSPYPAGALARRSKFCGAAPAGKASPRERAVTTTFRADAAGASGSERTTAEEFLACEALNPLGTCLALSKMRMEMIVPQSRYVTILTAAARLSLNANALRARCRRRARREGREVIARLGGGIVAIKFGVTWRVIFPE
jgi:hypothetical protein